MACVALVAVLTAAACGDISNSNPPDTTMHITPTSSSARPTPRPSPTRPRSPVHPPVQGTAADLRLWLQTIAWNRAAARSEVAVPRGSGAATSSSVSAVLDCIKRHESGDYTEHSHLADGSGAYQYIPSTWAVWSARAGYPGWSYAYEAPAAVQDAVTMYALTHGGAHNWDPAYGNDPCTVSLP